MFGPSRAAQSRSEPGRPPQARLEHHVITDAGGIPLAVTLTGGNRHDVTQLLPLVDKIPPIKGIRGRPRQRPERLYADRGYDYDCYRRELRAKGITPVIARRGTGLGTRRWVVEQTIALLHWFRRLRIRWEIRDDIHEARTTTAAWRDKPCYYSISKQDRTTAPELEQFLAKRMNAMTIEVDSSHLAMVTHPDAIADLIIMATKGTRSHMPSGRT